MACVGEARADRESERRGGRAAAAQAADEEEQEGTITPMVTLAEGTGGEMAVERGRLFRRKLTIQIFPQSIGDF